MDVPPSDETQDGWQGTFWQSFPVDPEAFADVVRSSPGIHVSLQLTGAVPPVQSEYGGYSSAKLARMTHEPSESQAARSAALRRALATYERDFERHEAARKQAYQAAVARLPEPPSGYYWAPDNGGLRFADVVVFRLWSRALGYMPGSE